MSVKFGRGAEMITAEEIRKMSDVDLELFLLGVDELKRENERLKEIVGEL